MRAYYTTNNAYDTIVIPQTGQALMVGAGSDAGERGDIAAFLAPDPDFGNWSGEPIPADLDRGDELTTAAQYGEVIAVRDEAGPLTILDGAAWVNRLASHRVLPRDATDWLATTDAATATGMDASSLRRLILAGYLRGTKHCRDWQIRAEDLTGLAFGRRPGRRPGRRALALR